MRVAAAEGSTTESLVEAGDTLKNILAHAAKLEREYEEDRVLTEEEHKGLEDYPDQAEEAPEEQVTEDLTKPDEATSSPPVADEGGYSSDSDSSTTTDEDDDWPTALPVWSRGPAQRAQPKSEEESKGEAPSATPLPSHHKPVQKGEEVATHLPPVMGDKKPVVLHTKTAVKATEGVAIPQVTINLNPPQQEQQRVPTKVERKFASVEVGHKTIYWYDREDHIRSAVAAKAWDTVGTPVPVHLALSSARPVKQVLINRIETLWTYIKPGSAESTYRAWMAEKNREREDDLYLQGRALLASKYAAAAVVLGNSAATHASKAAEKARAAAKCLWWMEKEGCQTKTRSVVLYTDHGVHSLERKTGFRAMCESALAKTFLAAYEKEHMVNASEGTTLSEYGTTTIKDTEVFRWRWNLADKAMVPHTPGTGEEVRDYAIVDVCHFLNFFTHTTIKPVISNIVDDVLCNLKLFARGTTMLKAAGEGEETGFTLNPVIEMAVRDMIAQHRTAEFHARHNAGMLADTATHILNQILLRGLQNKTQTPREQSTTAVGASYSGNVKPVFQRKGPQTRKSPRDPHSASLQ
jgi:hypothetical protein